MAKFLENSRWYQAYKELASQGKLQLPEYEQNENGEFLVKPGELFCRYPDCDKRTTEFSKTVNLRWHLKHHRDVQIANSGTGRFKQVEKDMTNAWYKELVESNQIMDESKDEEQSKEDDQEHQKPYVPWRKDLMDINRIKVRAIAKALGVFPCDACQEAGISCLSDMNICTIVMHHFDLRSPEELEQMGLNATNSN
ncbi:uncharacterized protein ACHE_80552A [Aspergillus chevalieri]|uniref:Uncharacterized protein n=1 Tax=Aspergillus chevalieri TaxID=182096 RepID=A0A7R7VXM4_ASPCH|nr:uncharacterized protein ACHE_80552A [Aspergillus chevalieri]BCR92652.1 hypothetical protein ACHE_80552A [Aspergillus chevalieri]